MVDVRRVDLESYGWITGISGQPAEPSVSSRKLKHQMTRRFPARLPDVGLLPFWGTRVTPGSEVGLCDPVLFLVLSGSRHRR